MKMKSVFVHTVTNLIEWKNILLMLKVMYSVFSYLFVLSLHLIQQGSSSSTMVHEQRPFERKAEEDDGKVSCCDGGLASLLGLLFMLFASVILSNSAVVWERRLWDGSGRTGLHLNNPHASVSSWIQAEWQTHRATQLLSCLSFPLPSHPTLSPPDTHMLKLCNPAEPAYVLGELWVLTWL